MILKKYSFVLCVILFVSAGRTQEKMMPVSDIRTGMMGIGKTVFSGTKIEDFDFKVIDIIKNFKPRRDLILVQLVGEHVEHTGVVAGMSGSPMYIDGKLIGALSYRMGLFQKEPIAGVTPIAQMMEIFAREKSRPEELAAARGLNEDLMDMAVGARDFDLQALLPPQFKTTTRSASKASLVPLEIPFFFSGFESNFLDLSTGLFERMGLTVQQSGGTETSVNQLMPSTLKPGSAYSVVIVDGDLGIQATGTVTYTNGSQVLGMGHPFLNSGAMGLPMGEAKIVTTLSSSMASTKMANLTNIVGTIHQDRTTGVMGVTGEAPAMIPVNLRYSSKFQEPGEFRFRVAEDRSVRSLTPLIFNIVLTSALESARLSVGDQTLTLNGKINLQGDKAIDLNNYYAGSKPSDFLTDGVQVAGDVASTLGALLVNNFEIPKITSVDLNFQALPKKKLAIVERMRLDKTVVRPGDNLTITVFLQEYQGEMHRVKRTIKLPENLNAGRISLYVGSGSSLTHLEARTTPQKFKPQNFNQLLNLLNNRRKNNFVFFQLRARDKGILVSGEELPNLPPSILSVMQAQKASGSVLTLRDRVLSEEKQQVDFAVSGGRTVWLKVDKDSF